MKSTINLDIVSRDKTESGFRSAERRAQSFGRKAQDAAREGAFDRIGRTVDGLMRVRQLSFGFDAAGRSLATVGAMGRDTSNVVAAMTRNILTFGRVAPAAMGGAAAATEGLAARMAMLAGRLAGPVAIVAGLTAGAYLAGDKWSRIGGGIARRAEDFGMTTQSLQARRGAAERFGVTADETDSAIEGLGDTLYDAKYGANNLALGVLGQLGLKMKEKPDGSIDTDAMLDDIADAIAKQKNPQVQRKLAAVFGVSSMLPALRKGSGALKAEGADYMASGAAFTDAEIERAKVAERKAVRLQQQLGAVEKGIGMTGMRTVGPISDTAVSAWRNAGRAGEDAGRAMKSGAEDLKKGAQQAGQALVEGARRAFGGSGGGAPLAPSGGGAGFAAFAARIRRQESGNRQFDRNGRPLTSNRGAVGIMQMLPETAERAARLGSVKWDRQRFYNDAAYNQQLGEIWLKHLLEKFGGSEVLAAAAYNAGEGRLTGYSVGKGANRRRVKGWLERFGDPRKGEISEAEFARRIPFEETNRYVANTARPGAVMQAPAVASAAPAAGAAAASKVEVAITLKNAPEGTLVRTRGAPGVDVPVVVARGMDYL